MRTCCICGIAISHDEAIDVIVRDKGGGNEEMLAICKECNKEGEWV